VIRPLISFVHGHFSFHSRIMNFYFDTQSSDLFTTEGLIDHFQPVCFSGIARDSIIQEKIHVNLLDLQQICVLVHNEGKSHRLGP
jgi:hypothetical protein